MNNLIIVAGIAGLVFLMLKKSNDANNLVKVAERTQAPSAWRGVIYV